MSFELLTQNFFRRVRAGVATDFEYARWWSMWRSGITTDPRSLPDIDEVIRQEAIKFVNAQKRAGDVMRNVRFVGRPPVDGLGRHMLDMICEMAKRFQVQLEAPQ